MNDFDLLFPADDLERWKRGELPEDWLTQQRDALLARMRAEPAATKMAWPTWPFPKVSQWTSRSAKAKS